MPIILAHFQKSVCQQLLIQILCYQLLARWLLWIWIRYTTYKENKPVNTYISQNGMNKIISYFLSGHQHHFCNVFPHLSVCLYQCFSYSAENKFQKGFGKTSRGDPWQRYEIWNTQKDSRKGLGKQKKKKHFGILLL